MSAQADHQGVSENLWTGSVWAQGDCVSRAQVWRVPKIQKSSNRGLSNRKNKKDSRLRSGSVQPAGHCSFYCVYTKGTTPKVQKHGYKNLRGEKLVFKECWYLNTHG